MPSTSLQDQLRDSPAEPTLNDKAEASGLAQTPVSPLAASMTGANPDQAKMAGTKAQKTTAFGSMGAQREDTLANQQRYAYGQRGASEAEQAAKQKATQLRQIGSLDMRVQGIIESKMKTPSTTGTAVAATQIDEAKLKSMYPSVDQAQLKSALDGWLSAAPGQKQQALVQVQKLLGSTEIKPENLDALVKEAGLVAGQAAASAIGMDQQMTIGQLVPADLQALGFSDFKSMADALGVEESALLGMSVSQVGDAARAMEAQQTASIQALLAQVNDPAVPQAIKDRAIEQLVAAGYTGSLAAAGKIAESAEQVQQADTVKIMGEEHKLEDLVGTSEKPGLVAQWMQQFLADPTTPISAQFKEQFPDLAKFAEDNRQALMEDLKIKQGEIKTFADTQQANRALADIGAGARLSDDVMKVLIPEWGTPQASKFALSSNLVSYLKSAAGTPNEANLKTLADHLASVAKDPKYGELIKELNELTPEQLTKVMDLSKPDSIKAMLDWRAGIADIKAGTADFEDLMSVLTGGRPGSGSGESSLGGMLTSMEGLSAVYPDAARQFRSLIDADNDGKLDDKTQIANRIKADPSLMSESLSSFAAGSLGNQSLRSLMQFTDKFGTLPIKPDKIEEASKEIIKLDLPSIEKFWKAQTSMAGGDQATRQASHSAMMNTISTKLSSEIGNVLPGLSQRASILASDAIRGGVNPHDGSFFVNNGMTLADADAALAALNKYNQGAPDRNTVSYGIMKDLYSSLTNARAAIHSKLLAENAAKFGNPADFVDPTTQNRYISGASSPAVSARPAAPESDPTAGTGTGPQGSSRSTGGTNTGSLASVLNFANPVRQTKATADILNPVTQTKQTVAAIKKPTKAVKKAASKLKKALGF